MRKRSKYRPKGVVLDVMTYVKSGIQTVASVPEAGVNLRLRNHMAFDEIMKGEPTSGGASPPPAKVRLWQEAQFCR